MICAKTSECLWAQIARAEIKSTGHCMDMKTEPGINISSVILGVAPEDVVEVSRRLAALEGVELHAVAEDGRMIVTIETESDGSMADTFEAINKTESDVGVHGLSPNRIRSRQGGLT